MQTCFQVPCRQGHTKCYNVSDICSYKLDKFHHLIPCRTGEHLQSCSGFSCNAMFKCNMSYCIPWAYVCDQKYDCPQGDDEMNLCKVNCSDMFKCKNANTCLHMTNVCDNIEDCPLGDDEFLCILHNLKCPINCICFSFAIKCVNLLAKYLLKKLPHIYVHISAGYGVGINVLSDVFHHVIIIMMHNSGIANICPMSNKAVKSLDFGENQIDQMAIQCFFLPHAQILKLNQNKIKTIHSMSFHNLSKLILLNLAANPLISLPDNAIVSLEHIKVVNVLFIWFTHIGREVFSNLKIDFVLATDYHICCVKPAESTCVANVPWHYSCSKLLPHPYKMVLTIISLFFMMFVLLSILLHFVIRKSGASFSITIIAMNVNELSLFVYYLLLLINDSIFGERFPLQELFWKAGVALLPQYWYCIIPFRCN